MSLGGNTIEIKSTKVLTEEEKIRYDFKNQKNNEKLKEWLMK